MVNVSTQLSAKMEAPYGEYSVPIARAAAPPSLVGSGAGSGQQPPAPRPGPAALPSPTSTGTCKAGDGGRKRVPNYLLYNIYIYMHFFPFTLLSLKKKARA